MRVLIDIGHPAHVHYFKYFIKIMTEKGHECLIVARNRGIVFELIKKFQLPFVSRGTGSKKMIGKMFYLLKADLKMIKIAKKFKPDIFLGFGSMYAAQAAWFLRKPSIIFNDTENAKLGQMLYKPFTKTICTPSCFSEDLGKKQINFNGFIELSYLHPNYFKPDESVLDLLKVKPGEKYVIIRFISFNAFHDLTLKGFSLEEKKKLVHTLSKIVKVFISSEGEIDDELKEFELDIPPDRLHDALAFSCLHIGEGVTTTSECAMMGTPNILVNSYKSGICDELKQRGLLFQILNGDEVIEKALEIIKSDNFRTEFMKRTAQLIEEKIDPTKFFVWLVENYPKSVKILKSQEQKT
ncbi:DUF354 domain-containing protein [Candidatus Woesearchaeota archaeon]|jgi:uncharacterized protein|nr:DUF354 domain-containing protein [Candidatus Woesearchaeota archaeon]MBT4368014.1 DUF354 domain-containing protein [Candidatus Woesearchaeota archaeon]MBT4712502.1 DUF354 domain-containing protein [Candidatus Woesearchaeota archaeon]MBT6639415.1 DUF354 domain-containing protein [Candidatus Woesearchaeota archaeon]MBT7133587.1 DUF354 domain-containing protein [Candidatus Woesearchaeota archaeon]